jgi:DNA polymerase I
MEHDALVHGRDDTSGVIGCSVQGTDRIRVFRREEGKLVSSVVPFEPFLLLTDQDILRGWKGDCRLERLSGGARFRQLAFFPHLDALRSARTHLQKKSGTLAGPDVPFLYFDDPVHQYLLISGKTHFHGLRFGDLRRMQIDLEAYCDQNFEFPNARRKSDRITAIAMSDTTGWERIISGRELGEAEMLEEMAAEISDRDPDVLEGHNFFRFDLSYLLLRARLYGFELNLGRDGSALTGQAARLQIGERRLNFTNHKIFGRHVIDTWFLAQLHGLRTGELDRYGLKAVARHFDVAAAERTYIPGDKASWYFDHEPDTLFRYSLDDVRETRAVSDLLSPLYFFEAQIFPYSYQDVAVESDVSKLDALVTREYLAQRHSIPGAGFEEADALQRPEVRCRGLAENVLRCHAVSLHASVMLAKGHCPKSDALGILPQLMQKLSQCKWRPPRAQEGSGQIEAEGWRLTCDAIMEALPAYLASPDGRFNDRRVAIEIATEAQLVLASLAQRVEEKGGQTIEVESDGLYFALPPGRATSEDASQFLRELASVLPGGVELHAEGPYPAMFTFDAGDHALLDREGQIRITGTLLRPLGLERFQKQCLEEMLHVLLEGRNCDILGVYERYREALQAHRFDISLLVKTETLQESLDQYQIRVKGARRRPRGVYEIALRSGRAYLEGDKLSYYVTGEGANVKVGEHCNHFSEWDRTRPDENVEYYKARLRELYEKLRPFVVEEP